MSKTVIMRKFSLNRDLKDVSWKETIWYNLLRTLCAGLVCGIIMAASGKGIENLYLYPLMWPFAYVLMTPVSWICMLFKEYTFMAIFQIVLSFFLVAVGDPVIYLLRIFFPRIVPVDRPPIISLNLTVLVLNADDETIVAGDLFE